MSRPGTIKENELRRLYCDERLSGGAVAKRIGVTQGAISFAMKRFGIPARGPAKLDLEDIRQRYSNGETLQEIADGIGMSRNTAWRAIAKLGIEARPAHRVKGKPLRERQGSQWKGSEAGYMAMHERVRRWRGTPSECEDCGTTKAIRYEWASISGNFGDIDDYRRLCVPCHRKFDSGRRAEPPKPSPPVT